MLYALQNPTVAKSYNFPLSKHQPFVDNQTILNPAALLSIGQVVPYIPLPDAFTIWALNTARRFPESRGQTKESCSTSSTIHAQQLTARHWSCLTSRSMEQSTRTPYTNDCLSVEGPFRASGFRRQYQLVYASMFQMAHDLMKQLGHQTCKQNCLIDLPAARGLLFLSHFCVAALPLPCLSPDLVSNKHACCMGF